MDQATDPAVSQWCRISPTRNRIDGPAKWLVDLQCPGPGWPRVRLREFAPALGERGLTEIEKRVQVADPESWGVRDLREQLAELSGDPDRYVAVLAEDLKSLKRYERIVVVLRDPGRLLRPGRDA
ncbi:hypothetical protein AB0J83_15135 [Actinoplanes sp. NPDC049596]|uniref:hypothetical protein n=1 Tax=unclassified Actinoplanes TaxID=2626549 RepID=UPI0034234C0C